MTRKPTEAELALWAQVAATVRPMESASRRRFARASAPHPVPGQHRAGDERPVGGLRTEAVLPSRQAGAFATGSGRATPNVLTNTLDGGWDRRIRTGALHPERTVDLHGLFQEQAREVLDMRIIDAISDDVRVVLVITGKGPSGMGVLRKAVPVWLESAPYRGHIAAIRTAHPRHGGSGALYVVLRRSRTPA